VTVPVAAQRLGTTIEAIRKRIGRGQLDSRKGNSGRTEVLVPTESAQSPPDDPTSFNVDPDTVRRVAGLEEEVSGLRAEVDHWRGKAEEVGLDAARAAGELVAEQRRNAELVATLTAVLAKAEARADRLEAALVESRRPWLARLLEAVRRR
jgi:hypothetical protein